MDVACQAKMHVARMCLRFQAIDWSCLFLHFYTRTRTRTEPRGSMPFCQSRISHIFNTLRLRQRDVRVCLWFFFLFFVAVRWPKAHASTTVLTILMSFISITPIYLFSNIYLFDHSFMHIYFICTLKLLKCGVCLCLCAAVAAFLLFPACLPILLWM